MSDPYYVAGPERAARVRTLFDRIAPRYDLINDVQSFGLHRLWKRRLLKLARVGKGAHALDVCCGTGDIAMALAQAGAQVVGCDFSGGMLSVAQVRAAQIPVRRLSFVQADALALPAGDATVDLVTIGYGLRNLADLQKGLSELNRVLKPGGTVLVLDFGKPKNPLWRAIYYLYLRIAVPIFGLIFCGDFRAYSYILDSLLKYPAQDGVAQSLRQLGCVVTVENFLGGVMSIHRAVKPASLRERHDVPLVTGDVLRK